jgi:hypothetical protein
VFDANIFVFQVVLAGKRVVVLMAFSLAKMESLALQKK